MSSPQSHHIKDVFWKLPGSIKIYPMQIELLKFHFNFFCFMNIHWALRKNVFEVHPNYQTYSRISTILSTTGVCVWINRNWNQLKQCTVQSHFIKSENPKFGPDWGTRHKKAMWCLKTLDTMELVQTYKCLRKRLVLNKLFTAQNFISKLFQERSSRFTRVCHKHRRDIALADLWENTLSILSNENQLWEQNIPCYATNYNII